MSEDHLTHPHDERIERFRADTVAGQAHWAGTGPAGTRCLTCDFAKFHGYYKSRNKMGALKPISCFKYKAMMGHAPTFDASQASCRFYEPGEGPPKRGG